MVCPMSVGRVLRLAVQGVGYVVAGTLVLGLLLPVATATHVWAHARGDDRAPVDTIFVLGAAQYDGVPSNWLASRLNHAAELYKQGIAPVIVTVGGAADGDRFTEAQAGKNYLVQDLGVPDSAVVEVNSGRDTLTSARDFAEVAKQNGWSSTVVVTDPAHSLRAQQMVRDQGLRAGSSPTRQGPSVATRSEQISGIVRETGGMLYYQVVERPGLFGRGLSSAGNA
ncbi:hypothetical protein CWC39_07700 [Corynebacterium heidelbergense]|uniref:DUF218 domain-containing protein n=1 Tax=Corynebacterium heidelbergense TaxID=2055947 RepID=A0A364VAA8_9CORY|nr:hypothetical protein CWC39_07700 [Corynebacterium heidelbergense]